MAANARNDLTLTSPDLNIKPAGRKGEVPEGRKGIVIQVQDRNSVSEPPPEVTVEKPATFCQKHKELIKQVSNHVGLFVNKSTEWSLTFVYISFRDCV